MFNFSDINNNDDLNLDQGKQFLLNDKRSKKKVLSQLNLIESDYLSTIEGFVSNTNISEFNSLLTDYNNAYSIFLESSMNQVDISQVSILNDQILSLAPEILSEIELLKEEDISGKEELNKMKSEILINIQNLENDKNEINNKNTIQSEKYMDDLEHKMQDTELKLTSNYVKYLLWAFFCLLSLIFTYYMFSSSNDSIILHIIIVVISLVIIYYEVIPFFRNLQVYM